MNPLSIRLNGMMLAPDGFLLNMRRQAFDWEYPCTLRKRLIEDLAGVMALFRANGRGKPPVLLVAAGEENLDLLFVEPQPIVPSGFEVLDGGLSWTLKRSKIKQAIPQDVSAHPWPFLVTLGYHPKRRMLVLGNLGQLSSLTFAGDRPSVLGKLESVAHEMTNSPLAKGVSVVCLGFGRSLAKNEKVTVAPRLQTALMQRFSGLPDPADPFDLDGSSSLSPDGTGQLDLYDGDSLGSNGADYFREAGCDLCVLALDPHPQDRKLLERLHHQGALRLVVIGESEREYKERDPSTNGAAWNGSGVGAFPVSEDCLRWETTALELHRADSPPSGGSFTASPSRRPSRRVRPVGAFDVPWADVEDAVAGVGKPLAWEDGVSDGVSNGVDAESAGFAAPAGTQPGAVDLCVLGVVQVNGLKSSAVSARTLALICYLAFHPNGATIRELEHWLWGRGIPPGDRALSNAVHRARSALGRNHEDDFYLPYFTANGAYCLSKEVTSDLERFKRLAKAADRAESCEAVLYYKKALSLVRGIPFGGGEKEDLYGWADISLRNHAECEIDLASHKLADLAMLLGDFCLARWSICKGLLITPGCEQCYRRRFLIAYHTGRRRELQRAMGELKRILADLEDPDDVKFEVSSELKELYQELVKSC